MSEQANESGENVSAIQSLVARAQDLSSSIDRWNNAYMVLVALTVVLAAGVFIAQFVVVKKSRRLAVIQQDLMAEKDRQSATSISAAQRAAGEADERAAGANKVAAQANERAAGLEVKALTLRKELRLQGPRANLITNDKRRSLVDALKPFAKQRIDVRHRASVIMVNNRIVQSTPIGDDTVGLANTLIGVLKEAAWNSPPSPLPSNLQGQGITVEILREASPDTRAATRALVAGLKAVPLEVNGPSEVADNLGKRIGEDVIQPAFDENTVILDVLVHP